MGGAETVLYTLVEHLRANFDQTVIYFHGGPFVEKIEQLGVRTIKINGYFCLYDPVFFWRLAQALKGCRPDVIHTLLWAANVFTRLCAYPLGKPLLNVYHNNVDQDGFIRRALDRLTATMCDQPIAVSDQVAQSLKNSWQSVHPVRVITNGIALPKPKTRVLKKDLGMSDESFVIGAVGRLVPVKSFDVLLRAAAQVMDVDPGVHVVLIGSGQEKDALCDLAESLNITDRVHFVVGASALDYYPIFDCFVQSSAKEGVSLALLEAMSFALPCIVMGDLLHHPVITHGVDGYICEPFNVDKLAEMVSGVIEQKKAGIDCVMFQAKKTIERGYTATSMNHKYEKLFVGLCNKFAK
jgi:glycosyltransferase involved in cell wall biosynthesis